LLALLHGYDINELNLGESQPFIRNVFTLNSCSHIVGSQVISFEDEADMLQKWRDFVEEVDPDVVIGYNISNFDFPYLMDRAKALDVTKFPYLGRLKGRYIALGILTCTLSDLAARYEEPNEGHALFVKSIRAARLQGNSARRASSTRRPAIYATRAQASELLPQLRLCSVPGRTKGGRASFRHH
jgi:hypothetical protein